jgi:hypothetical protein
MPGLDQKTLEEIRSLSVPDRIEALGEIWDTIPDSLKESEVSELEKRILDVSLEYSEKHPEDSVSWDNLRKELRSRLSAK